jgi:hypothetical protein
MWVDRKGLSVGPPLRELQGVLLGVPTYVNERNHHGDG